MRQTRKSSLFLVELIIAILFFSLSAAVCVKLFSASYLEIKEAEYRDTAILEAQSIAEIFRNNNGDMEEIIKLTDAVELQEGEYIYYIYEGDDVYDVLLQVSGEFDMPKLEIDVITPNGTESIVEIDTQIYVPQ